MLYRQNLDHVALQIHWDNQRNAITCDIMQFLTISQQFWDFKNIWFVGEIKGVTAELNCIQMRAFTSVNCRWIKIIWNGQNWLENPSWKERKRIIRGWNILWHLFNFVCRTAVRLKRVQCIAHAADNRQQGIKSCDFKNFLYIILHIAQHDLSIFAFERLGRL